ncbi:MAG: hypothetical protein AUH19_06640 [Verrucomicrobia bacterium 13_2_20CM_55_10]|nr:MAG: hypothetical protein AUH19_06640 [Verrucomicrobia bacterium 13_2_20CM_55_10]
MTDYKASKPWRLRITREGKAIQEISIIGAGAGVRRTSKSFVLSEEDMRGLAAVVEQANFFGLPNKISNSEFDHFAGLCPKNYDGRLNAPGRVCLANRREGYA